MMSMSFRNITQKLYLLIKIVDKSITDLSKTNMFKYYSKFDIERFTTKNSTIHYHELGVSPDVYSNPKYSEILNIYLKVTSLAKDKDGKVFVSTVESNRKDISLYSIQFHPERIPEARFDKNTEAYSTDGIIVNYKIGLGFIEDVRKSMVSKGVMSVEDQKKYGALFYV